MFNRKATYVHLLNGIAHGGIASASGRRVAYDGDDFGARVARNEAHPRICFADGGGSDDDDDSDEAKKKKADDDAKKKAEEKQYSKADLERVVKDRLKKLTREHEALQAEKKKSDEALAELTSRIEELEDSGGDKGADAKDTAKELATLRRELKRATDQISTLTKEKETATKSLGETTERYKRTRIDGLLRDGLIGAKAHKDGIADAVELMRIRGKAEIDEDDRFTITIDGVPYEDAKEASAAFLKKHPYLAEGMQSHGDGHPRPGNSGGRVLSEKQMESMPVSGLLSAGLQSPPK
jgi:NADH dehydrogenase/NADH:ubiquinone oxidoreductase subunit G